MIVKIKNTQLFCFPICLDKIISCKGTKGNRVDSYEIKDIYCGDTICAIYQWKDLARDYLH